MLSPERMKEQAPKYQIYFDEDTKEALIAKDSNQTWVKVSIKRAIDWVNAGIDDLDCRSKKEMLEMLNTWLEGGTK